MSHTATAFSCSHYSLSYLRGTNSNVFDRHVLTNPFSPGAVAGGSSVSEPPTKKPRREGPSPSLAELPLWVTRYRPCMDAQVFPHIDRELAALPENYRIYTNRDQVLRRMMDDAFVAEYQRNNGALSPEYELAFSQRVRREIQAIITPKVNRALRKVPPPGQVQQSQAPVRRFSESPVPVPTFPQRPPSRPITPTIKKPEPVVIDDDDRPNGNSGPAPRISQVPIPQVPRPRAPQPSSILPPAPATPVAYQQHSLATAVSLPRGNPQTSEGLPALPRNLPVAPASVIASVPAPIPPRPFPATVPAQAPPRPSLANILAPAAPRSPPTPRYFPPAQLVKPKRYVPTSPYNFRTRAHATAWHGCKRQVDQPQLPRYFSSSRRPYLSAEERKCLSNGAPSFIRVDASILEEPVTAHVDFGLDEIKYLRTTVIQSLGLPAKEKRNIQKDLHKLLRRHRKQLSKIFPNVHLKHRTTEDVKKFFLDVISRKTASTPAMITLRNDSQDQQGEFARSSRVPSLLLAREISGHRGHGAKRHYENFASGFRNCREDDLALREEWTNCAGDISTIVWVSNDNFICGTTEHSDAHNQQYNKPGNLVLGSCSLATLRAYPHHRIVRPIVSKGENSTDAMRESQDPWLYSSVVSSDYDVQHDRAFTSGFDRTVKIWRVQRDAKRSEFVMNLLGEWKHGGNVNFVAASKHSSGIVATASDVAAEAVRIYDIHNDNINASPFRSYSCSRVTDDMGNLVSTEKWAYFPATMQWGLSAEVQHLLLVGYSPRSRTGDDNDIPEDRKDSGEICLWDGLTGERWRITSVTTQNVFEVLWHPSQASFIAATSPLGLDVESGVRTQIRIFRVSDNAEYGGKAFSPVQTLDCSAVDINELTIKPNSFTYCYITAGCTDGKIYVWDTARGDRPIHVLKHSEPIDEFRGDREREDVGVKFTAWGSIDRFYTGSSDGVVKVWDVRSLKKPLVRDLIEVPAPVSCGMFSPDGSKLAIGDASGRVFLLSVDNEEDEKAPSFMTVRIPGSGKLKRVRPPKLMIPHPDPDPPQYDADGRLTEREGFEAVRSRARGYLQNHQLERHPKPHFGVVQGPRYAELRFFRREYHFDNDPSQPLLAKWERLQDDSNKVKEPQSRRSQFMSIHPVLESARVNHVHEVNMASDLRVEQLPEETQRQLKEDCVDLESPEYVFNYDELDDDDEEEDEDEF
ncbi:hypothetical protein B0H66DRAFT_502117 [Apodospora peruviana]|uniref:Rik1-associated factor 1 n=1 Tax=Apodospora peruviana TaxID=516989 RepID=A0AAE0M188_9PEZI|nr:hypothetical protein B0H66DRAFT_502117 [Apodospora peruviana]